MDSDSRATPSWDWLVFLWNIPAGWILKSGRVVWGRERGRRAWLRAEKSWDLIMGLREIETSKIIKNYVGSRGLLSLYLYLSATKSRLLPCNTSILSTDRCGTRRCEAHSTRLLEAAPILEKSKLSTQPTCKKMCGKLVPKYAPSISRCFWRGIYTSWHLGQYTLTLEVDNSSLIPIGRTIYRSHITLEQ